MAIDVGDVYQLTFAVTDAGGAPANATACTVTVTLPDLTTVTPAVTNAVMGTYTATYPTTMAGRHTVLWVATGTNACAGDDDFNVLTPGRMLISLAEAKAGLGVTGTAKDEDIRSVIEAATPIMEDICGPLLRQTRVESYDGGVSQINLLWSPIVSVTGIIETYGSNYTRPLTQQDIFSGSGLDAFGFTVDLVTGIVTRRAIGAAINFASGKRNIQITYVSGRAAISGNILLATRRLIRHLWSQEQQSFRPNVLAAPDPNMTTSPAGFAVPRAVVELCADSTRAPGLA